MSRTEDRSQAMLASVAQSLALGLLVVLSHATNARSQPSPAPSPAPASTPAQQTLKVEELDQLVSPIALYPDTLLASVLMASTYPLEVVEASRWADENKSLKGEALKAATDKQSWDDSIKQLTATPSVLNMMSTKLSWTKQLGDAVLAQQPDVMDAVQRLRARAQANKMLESTKEQKVSVRTEQSKQVIVIEPTEPNTIYVPYYNPAVVYGAWPYPAYPPYYYPPVPGYYAGAAIATGLAFGAGIAVGAWAARGFWGGGIGWGNNNINVNRNVNINNANINNWSHNPAHRQGVRYNNADVANKFNRGADARGGAQNRMDYRGRDGQQVLRPSQGGGAGAGAGAGNRGDRPQTLDKGGAGQRQNASNKGGAGQRQAADKAGAGQRQNAANRGGDQRPSPSNRSGAGGGGGGREQAFSNVGSGGRNAMAQSARGNASLGGGGGHANIGAGGGGGRGGGGGFQGGGGGGRGGGGGGGRRSDINLKHDIVLLGHLNNGLGFYRYSYNGSDKPYVGVMAQEVQVVMPDAVTRGSDGYLRVHYEKLGVKFQTYGQWIASGGQIPATARNH